MLFNAVMVSGLCGFDQWIDNHLAIDGHQGLLLDELAEQFELGGYYYHWQVAVYNVPVIFNV